MDKRALADCVVFSDIRAGPCWLTTQCCLMKTICWDDSIKGNQLARKLLDIAQRGIQARRVQNEDNKEREEMREKEKKVHARKCVFVSFVLQAVVRML